MTTDTRRLAFLDAYIATVMATAMLQGRTVMSSEALSRALMAWDDYSTLPIPPPTAPAAPAQHKP